MGLKKGLYALLLTGIIATTSSGCITPQNEMYLFNYPIYPTNLTPGQKRYMCVKECERQGKERSEIEEGGEKDYRVFVPIFSIRF